MKNRSHMYNINRHRSRRGHKYNKDYRYNNKYRYNVITNIINVIKIYRFWGLKKTWASYEQKFGFTENQQQYVLPKVRQLVNIGQD